MDDLQVREEKALGLVHAEKKRVMNPCTFAPDVEASTKQVRPSAGFMARMHADIALRNKHKRAVALLLSDPDTDRDADLAAELKVCFLSLEYYSTVNCPFSELRVGAFSLI